MMSTSGVEKRVDVTCRGPIRGISPRTVKQRAIRILSGLGVGPVELSIVLCDDGFIRGLNRQFRHLDKPTDVLSFPQDDSVASPLRQLGDVIISLETASRQCGQWGRSLRHEVTILLIHGVLHLLGHTHDTDADEAIMEGEADRLRGLFRD